MSFADWELHDFSCLAGHCPFDKTGDLFGGTEQHAIDCCDIAARHAEARVTEESLDSQFAQAQFVRRAGVGVAEAMRRVGAADNSSPRLGKYGSIGPVRTTYGGEDIIAIALKGRRKSLWPVLAAVVSRRLSLCPQAANRSL